MPSGSHVVTPLQERAWPDTELRFVERVYLPHNCQDYCV